MEFKIFFRSEVKAYQSLVGFYGVVDLFQIFVKFKVEFHGELSLLLFVFLLEFRLTSRLRFPQPRFLLLRTCCRSTHDVIRDFDRITLPFLGLK